MICRGLHCAGCGHGIPAALVLVGALVLASLGLHGVAHELVTALYWLAGSIVVAGVAVSVGVSRIHNSSLQACVTWDETPMMGEVKYGTTEWANVQRAPIRALPAWPDYPAYSEGWRGGLPVQPNDVES